MYFATNASYSNGYAVKDANGFQHMYLSKVLTGVFTRGNPAMLVPPPRDPNNKAVKFDSVVNNENSPKIFVIFTDSQAYPEYLIQYAWVKRIVIWKKTCISTYPRKKNRVFYFILSLVNESYLCK